jgi:serine/threonine-protein kinase HipA
VAKALDVYLHKDLVGELVQTKDGQTTFRYAESWLENPLAYPLSHSLPLRAERFSQKECRAYFAGVLPEERNREIIAGNLGISARNDYSMLDRIGGECAGAVTFLASGQSIADRKDDYRELTDDELVAILKELPKRPLLAGDKGIRLSLAGAQDKIAVRVKGSLISLPLDDAPSTHILKPAIERFEGIVYNEALCMNLAAAIGMPAAPVEIRTVNDMTFLLIERYDRIHRQEPNGEIKIARAHQEDFCQALNIVSEMKYQREGGPSLKNSFALLREVSSTPVTDLARLLDAVIFNYLVGNNDAHGKNFSLLYSSASRGNLQIRLAPLYDLFCTAFYPELTREMAMKLGGEYSSEKIFPKNFEKFAEEAGLAKPLVRRRVVEVAEAVLTSLNRIDLSHPASEGVAELIRNRATRTRASFSTSN